MMGLWIAMAVLAAAATVPLLAPLYRAARSGASSSSPAVAIYRDQLSEVDRDLARGVIADREAGAARTEIARRLIRAGDEIVPADRMSGRTVRVASIAVIAVPVAALGLYLLIGSPEYPDQPLTSRQTAEPTQDIAVLVAQVEAHLALAPGDGAGWAAIAPVYTRLGRLDDAVRAYRNVVVLMGSTAVREADFGEAIVRAKAGAVIPEARGAFERAVALAPDDPRSRFYLALGLGQQGKVAEAKTAWDALIAGAPADASWLAIAKAELAKLDAPGTEPTAGDVEAAATMSPADRQAMIEGMVASLDARLKDEPGDADGWARLVRSYMVLGRADDARAALERARGALSADPAKVAVVEAAAREAGLSGD